MLDFLTVEMKILGSLNKLAIKADHFKQEVALKIPKYLTVLEFQPGSEGNHPHENYNCPLDAF